MSDQENPPTKVPTSYDAKPKEERPETKAPESYSATAKEEPESPAPSSAEGN